MNSESSKQKAKKGNSPNSCRIKPYAIKNQPHCSFHGAITEEKKLFESTSNVDTRKIDPRLSMNEKSLEEDDLPNTRGAQQPERTTVMNTTLLYENDSLLEIVKRICQETVENDKVPEKFIKYITTFLLSVTDILPEEKAKIHNIISVLVNIGMRYDNSAVTGGLDVNALTDSFEIPQEFINIHHKCETLPTLSKLFNLDKNIKELMDEKLKIYNSLNSSAGTSKVIVVSDSDSERFDSFQCHNNSGQSCLRNSEAEKADLQHFEERSEFSKEVVELAIQKIEKIVNVKCEEIEGTGSTQSSAINDGTHNEPQISHSFIEDSISLNQGSSSDKIDHQQVIAMPDPPHQLIPQESTETDSMDIYRNIDSNVLLKVHQYDIVILKGQRKLCFGGCRDGTICIFCLETGTLFDCLKNHSDSITSVITWDLKIVTSSLDGRVSLFDPVSKVFRSLKIGEPINCAVENCGILYLGTSLGSIFKVNIRSMTHNRSQVQVSPTAILDMQVFQDRNGPSIIVAAQGKPVTIRSAENGIILFTLKNLKDCKAVGMISTSTLIFCGANENNTSFSSISNGEDLLVHRENVGANCLHLVNQHFFIGGNDGRIRVYNNKAVCIYVINGPGKMISYFTIHKKKMIICYDNHLVISIELPSQLLCLIRAPQPNEC